MSGPNRCFGVAGLCSCRKYHVENFAPLVTQTTIGQVLLSQHSYHVSTMVVAAYMDTHDIVCQPQDAHSECNGRAQNC
jgi:hypothetical protein